MGACSTDCCGNDSNNLDSKEQMNDGCLVRKKQNNTKYLLTLLILLMIEADQLD